jgi:hypothetical protein
VKGRDKLRDEVPGIKATSGFALFKETVQTTSDELAVRLILDVVNAATHSSGGSLDINGLNAGVAAVHGIAPQDEFEAMLAIQMIGVHKATVEALYHLRNAGSAQSRETASNAANKLARTFAAQLEALSRYRGKGQQKVVVEHVHVHKGGQAIVGAVEGGGGRTKNRGQGHA